MDWSGCLGLKVFECSTHGQELALYTLGLHACRYSTNMWRSCVVYLCRPDAKLSEPGADRIILGKSLTLTNLLVTVMGQQIRIPGNNGRLPNSIASLVGGGFAGSGQEEGVLVGALKEVAMQDDWEEAAVRAQHILESLGGTSAGQDMEMEDAIPG